MEFRSVSAGGYDRMVSGERCEAESGGGWADVSGHGFFRNDRELPDPGSREIQSERTHLYGCKIGRADITREFLSSSERGESGQGVQGGHRRRRIQPGGLLWLDQAAGAHDPDTGTLPFYIQFRRYNFCRSRRYLHRGRGGIDQRTELCRAGAGSYYSLGSERPRHSETLFVCSEGSPSAGVPL